MVTYSFTIKAVMTVSLPVMILLGCSEAPMYIKTNKHTYICKMGCQNYSSWLQNPTIKTKLWKPKVWQAPK
jgi:hypothetical protein